MAAGVELDRLVAAADMQADTLPDLPEDMASVVVRSRKTSGRLRRLAVGSSAEAVDILHWADSLAAAAVADSLAEAIDNPAALADSLAEAVGIPVAADNPVAVAGNLAAAAVDTPVAAAARPDHNLAAAPAAEIAAAAAVDTAR